MVNNFRSRSQGLGFKSKERVTCVLIPLSAKVVFIAVTQITADVTKFELDLFMSLIVHNTNYIYLHCIRFIVTYFTYLIYLYDQVCMLTETHPHYESTEFDSQLRRAIQN
jgi:hypothetical protein